MGVAIVSMAIHGQFVATGSEDGFLRIWSTDFSTVTMETGTQYTNMYTILCYCMQILRGQ